jgi:Zn-dependent protease with chaperone function
MNKLAADIGANFNSPIGNTVRVGDLVSIILSNAIVVAGIIMLFFIVIGGIMLIASAGQDDPQKAAQGKKAVTTGVIGFIIIFASYWIVQIIEVMTGLNILSPPGL